MSEALGAASQTEIRELYVNFLTEINQTATYKNRLAEHFRYHPDTLPGQIWFGHGREDYGFSHTGGFDSPNRRLTLTRRTPDRLTGTFETSATVEITSKELPDQAKVEWDLSITSHRLVAEGVRHPNSPIGAHLVREELAWFVRCNQG